MTLTLIDGLAIAAISFLAGMILEAVLQIKQEPKKEDNCKETTIEVIPIEQQPDDYFEPF